MACPWHWTRRDVPLKHCAAAGGRRRTVSGATMEVHAEMTLDYGTATRQTRRIERLLHYLNPPGRHQPSSASFSLDSSSPSARRSFSSSTAPLAGAVLLRRRPQQIKFFQGPAARNAGRQQQQQQSERTRLVPQTPPPESKLKAVLKVKYVSGICQVRQLALYTCATASSSVASSQHPPSASLHGTPSDYLSTELVFMSV